MIYIFNNILKEAYKFAKDKRSEFFTIEHVIYILFTKFNSEIKLAFDKDSVIEAMLNYIENYIPKSNQLPLDSVLLIEIVNKLEQLDNANIDDFLSLVIQEKKTFASRVLEYYIIANETNINIDDLEIFDDELEFFEENEDLNIDLLSTHTTELVSLAKENKFDPVIGRDKEIKRLIEILSRRKKNNPILVGESGVGKTSIVEGFATLIANSDVPDNLKDSLIYSIDVTSIVAGTKYRGDFEQKLKKLIVEIENIEKAIIFIDEIHTIVGAGSASDSNIDIANILKPYLSSGRLKCIGATTFSEYRNYFKKDKALNRRFSKIDVMEPSIDDTILILDGLKYKYQDFHKVTYTKQAIEKSAFLAKLYIKDKFLPDSAIDIIDEAGVVAKLNNKTKVGVDIIEDVISSLANIPSKNISSNKLTKIKNLSKNLKKTIFGQDKAIDILVNKILINKAGLSEENKPIGSFLFTGPTGVGKTEVAKTLAKELGIEFIRFDMSEYKEAHSISKLIGAPAGYVGFEKGGLLTEAVKKNPHAVLLLDEIEKAHIDIMPILLQIMDNATLTDNNGEISDFQNIILILTSNLGAKESVVVGFEGDKKLNESKAIKEFFAPEFRNRLDSIVSFNHLEKDVIFKIIDKFILELKNKLKDKNISLTITKRAKEALVDKGYDKEFGARPLKRVIEKEIKEKIAQKIIFSKVSKIKVDYKGEFIVS